MSFLKKKPKIPIFEDCLTTNYERLTTKNCKKTANHIKHNSLIFITENGIGDYFKMAKLKLKLDQRYLSTTTNEAQLKIGLNHLSKSTYINTGIYLKLDQWDKKKLIVTKHPRCKSLNDEIKELFLQYELALHNIERKFKIDGMSLIKLRDMLIATVNKEQIDLADEKSVSCQFANFMECKDGRTRNLYECTWKKIKEFEGINADSLRFDEINIDWLNRFNKHMAETAPSANSRGIHMRNLRAVFNYAIDNEVTTNYPFRRFKIKTAPTQKRNFKVETLRAIFNATNLDPYMVKYLDIFKLIFMLRGINFVDLCNLKEIYDGRIEYVRAKTHKPYSIKIEPEMEEIIAKYQGDKYLLNFMDKAKSYRVFYNTVCQRLRKIKTRLNEVDNINIERLTTYWARHTWATIAASLDIPKETIAAGLGHSGRTVTDIYIEFDSRKVDEANRRVLDWVFYGRK